MFDHVKTKYGMQLAIRENVDAGAVFLTRSQASQLAGDRKEIDSYLSDAEAFANLNLKSKWGFTGDELKVILKEWDEVQKFAGAS